MDEARRRRREAGADLDGCRSCERVPSRPRARSALMSSTCSRPTATRIRPWPDAGRLALLLGQPAVRGARRMRDGGLGVAQVGGDRADARAVDHVEGVAARAASALVALDDRTTPPRRRSPTAAPSPARAADATPGRGSRRARPAAAPRASGASASALALCACMRMPSVSRPFSTTQALNGDRRHAGGAHHRHERSSTIASPRRRSRRRSRAPGRRGTWCRNG